MTIETKPNYQLTRIACYLGFITQAIAANFAPILYLRFHTEYGITLGKLALLSAALFLTQIAVDLFCTFYVDRIGYRRSIVASEVFAGMGFVGLAVLPKFMDPFAGILISVMIYAVGCGLIEVLCSPIIEALPTENKEASMSLLHSFYCWGAVGTIVISTVFLRIVGMDHWRWLACMWALVPFVNVYFFSVCPIEKLVEEGEGTSMSELLRKGLFWIFIVLMMSAGASEISMAQWASAYVESALGISKMLGDLLGPCLFAVTMGFARILYASYGEKLDLLKCMIGSAFLCLICYILAASTMPMLGLVGCICCGFSIGILWPGTLSVASKRLPTGGTAMFALLAVAGDVGGSIGPAAVGFVAQFAGDNIRIGMYAGMVFPILVLIGSVLLRRRDTL